MVRDEAPVLAGRSAGSRLVDGRAEEGRQGSARAAGFSFGSRIALQLAAQESGIGRVIAAGFPTRVAEREYAHRVRVPKYFVQSTRDEFGPREELAAFFESLAEPKQLEWVEAEDHFFAGALDAFEGVVERIGREG